MERQKPSIKDAFKNHALEATLSAAFTLGSIGLVATALDEAIAVVDTYSKIQTQGYLYINDYRQQLIDTSIKDVGGIIVFGSMLMAGVSGPEKKNKQK